MHWLIVLFAVLLGLAAVAGVTALLAVLLLAFVAAPSFWGAFWLVLVVLVVFTSASKAF